MRIGLFMTPQWPPGSDLSHGFDDLLEQAQTARDAGFSSILIGQHMVTGPEMQMFQTVPLMARLLPEIEGMQIGPGVLLLPMLSPVMVAEEAATIDWMSNGNYVLAAGLGYRTQEFEAMETRKSLRVSRLEESIHLIKRLWTEDRVSHHGKHFDISDVGASVRPKQAPHPPIWLGGDVEAAVRRAGRIADAWLGSPTATLSRLEELLFAYHDERRSAGLPILPCPIIRECFVGQNEQHVERVRKGPLLYKYEAYAGWGHNDTSTTTKQNTAFADKFDEYCQDRFLFGSPEQVLEDLHRYAQTLGTDHLILRTQWPGLEQDEAINNIKRIGQLINRL